MPGGFKEHVYVFFCQMPKTKARSGAFQNGAKPLGPELEAEGRHVLVFYCSIHLHLFETPLNGPLFWAFDKKRHTHAPSQDLRQTFWR